VESLGEKLKSAREGKELDLEQVSKDTKIAIRYLRALELEDFSGFPGETYITGFLRNYGVYLDLDVQELLSLYRALKIQEQPVPVEQLLRQPSSFPKAALAVVLVIIALGVAAAGLYYLMTTRPGSPQAAAPAPRDPVEYVMSGDSLDNRFYRGDTILVSFAQDQFKLELQNIGEAVTIRTPGGQVILDLSQDANIDLDNDGIPDLQIRAFDYVKNNAENGVQLHLELGKVPALAAAGDSASAEAAGVSGQQASTVIFSSPNPYPFTLQSNFQGYCMFRWEILMERDRRDRNERYFQRSEEHNIQAQNGIRIWISNAQAAKFQVIGGGRTVPVEIGGAGEVVVTEIKWVKDDDNRYRLIVARLETGST